MADTRTNTTAVCRLHFCYDQLASRRFLVQYDIICFFTLEAPLGSITLNQLPQDVLSPVRFARPEPLGNCCCACDDLPITLPMQMGHIIYFVII